MEELQRDFKGIFIPKEIWFDENLTALDKVILAELDSLDSSEEGCFASNSYLAKFCQCSEIKITTTITKLVNLGYIKIAKFDGRKRYVKSNISRVIKNIRQSYKKYKSDLYKIGDINIDNNIDYKKEINKEKKSQTLKNLIEEMIKDKSYLLKIKGDLQINDKTIKEQLEGFVEYWKEKDAKGNERWSREKFFSTKRRFRTRLDRGLNYGTIKQTEEKQKTPEELKKMEEIAKLFTS